MSDSKHHNVSAVDAINDPIRKALYPAGPVFVGHQRPSLWKLFDQRNRAGHFPQEFLPEPWPAVFIKGNSFVQLEFSRKREACRHFAKRS